MALNKPKFIIEYVLFFVAREHARTRRAAAGITILRAIF